MTSIGDRLFSQVMEQSPKLRELGCKTATLVTRDEDGEETVDGGTIAITSAWRFLIEGQV
jgi:predicted AAA+ superfamily ATPase